MKNILLTIAYDGAGYFGWQRQNNAVTIQETIENTLSQLLDTRITIAGAGRTDTGVHALCQKASFFADDLNIPLSRMPMVLNSRLPDDIVILSCEEVPESFNPRFHAKMKTYRYQVLNCEYPNPLNRRYSWHVRKPLDIEAMKAAAKEYIGTYDYSAFCARGSNSKTFVRTVYDAYVEKEGDLISFYVTGNGFLYNMVRIMMGTLVYTGTGKIQPKEINEIIMSKDRTRAGITAPPQGLCMFDIKY